MSRYDDERIVALLHDAVPATPEVPDRLAAIRDRAGRQRAAVWTQTLGAVASVVLVLGLAAAVANAGGAPVRPVDDPLAALARAFDGKDAFRFELTTEPAARITEPVDPGLELGNDPEGRLTTHVVGASTAGGNLQVDGDLSLLYKSDEFHMRYVDGVVYSSVPGAMRGFPSGATWMRNGQMPSDAAEPDMTSFTRLVSGIATDVRYVGPTTVRGTPAAEYVLTVPKRWTKSDDVVVTFALDARGRLRRAVAEVSFQTLAGPLWNAGADSEDPAPTGEAYDPLMLHVELHVWGYGDRVEVSAPPESEVYDPTTEAPQQIPPVPMQKLAECFRDAKDDSAKRTECVRLYAPPGAALGYAEAPAVTPSP